MSETQPQTQPTAPSGERRFLEVVLVLAFLVAISVPGIMMFVAPPTQTNTGEPLAPLPARPTTLEALAKWPGEFKAYFRDRYGFRQELIRWNAHMKVSLLGVSSSPKVVVGRGGWLHYADERGVEDFRATSPFTQEELEAWRTVVMDWARFLSARGIPLIVVVAPNKATVYSDTVPRWMTRVGEQSRHDQLYESLAGEQGLELIDLRPELAEARKQGLPLYFRTDTHWNDLGAYVGFRELSKRLAKRFPGVTVPPAVGELKPSVVEVGGGDLARFLGLKEELSDVMVSVPGPEQPQARFIEGSQAGVSQKDMEFEPRRVSERPGAPIARAVLFRDSFANAMLPRLAELFGRAVYAWTTEFDYELVEREKPDVVIVELIERVLMRPAPKRAPESLRGEQPQAAREAP